MPTTVTRLDGRPRKPCRRPGATTQPVVVQLAPYRDRARFVAAWRRETTRPGRQPPASAS